MSTEDIYFAILRTYLWGSPFEVVSVDWQEIIQLASRQGTLPLITDYALKLSGKYVPSAEQKMMMKQVTMQNMLHQQKLRGYLKMVKDCLDAAGIPFVLLKGFGLAALYPNPSVRSSGDVDIWVGKERFHDACLALRDLPNVLTEDQQEKEGTRHFNLHWENLRYVVEVHPVAHSFVSKRENERYLELEAKGLDVNNEERTVSVDSVEYCVPSIEFNVLYVFLHLWHHYLSEGVQMKQLIDWCLVLHQWRMLCGVRLNDTLKADLKLFHLMEPWHVFGWIVVNKLGLPKEDMPYYEDGNLIRKKAELLLTYIIEGGNRDYIRKKVPGAGLLHKFASIRFMWLDYQVTKKLFPAFAKNELFSGLFTAIKKNIIR